ncbi:hypothetical protein FRC09_001610 [Ceratobasidium sp. 395]|nr:hypothetical protein FRC09_001610 [Ceratobasidium sp. 395]
MSLDTHSGTGLGNINEGMELSDGDVLEEEGSFSDLTAEGYLGYDRRYAEDPRAEFDEMTTKPGFSPTFAPEVAVDEPKDDQAHKDEPEGKMGAGRD